MNKSDKIKAVCTILAITAIIKIKKAKRKQLNKSKRKHKKIWCQERLLKRVSNKLLVSMPATELKVEDLNCCGISNEILKKLLELVGPLTTKQDTVMRESIPVTTRLLIALRYLTTGCSFVELSYTYDVSVSAISNMIPVTLDAIYKVLSKEHLKGCKTVQEWKDVAQAFYNKWQFPMCLGAIDGKHIAIRTFSKHASSYRNYMGSSSIILFAVVDANYKFIMVDVGANGGVNGSTALSSSDIGDTIKNNLLSFPQDEDLPGTNIKAPYVFVSNDTFNISQRILQPYNETYSPEEKIYNYRLSKALQVVEKAFVILSSRFKILQREIKLSPEKAKIITLACCALHNFLLNEGVSEEFIGEQSNLFGLEKCPVNISTSDSSNFRQIFADFFNKLKVFFIETK